MAKLNFRRDLVPFLVATVGEFAALVLWLKFRDAGSFQNANLALWIGFAVERIAVAIWVRYVYGRELDITAAPVWVTGSFLLIITVAEVGIWDVWLRVARGSSGMLAGAIVLFVLIHALHSIEMGVVRARHPLIYARNGRTVFFSLMETVGGAGWLWLLMLQRPTAGALMLLSGLTVEHLIQGGSLKPSAEERSVRAARVVPA